MAMSDFKPETPGRGNEQAQRLGHLDRLVRELRAREHELEDLSAEHDRLAHELDRQRDLHTKLAESEATRLRLQLQAQQIDEERRAGLQRVAQLSEALEREQSAGGVWQGESARLQRELTATQRELARAEQNGGALEEARLAASEARAELERARSELGATRGELQAVNQRLTQATSEYPARIRELEQTASALTVGLRQIQGDIARASSSRAWRYGHFVTRMLRRLAMRPIRTQGALARALSRIERIEASTTGRLSGQGPDSATKALPAPKHSEPAVRAREELPLSREREAVVDSGRSDLASRVRQRLGPVSERDGWPLVSVLVISRDGRPHLQRLIAGLLHHTDYPDLELIVVDNASSDGSAEYLRSLDVPFALTVVSSETNLSFSEANQKAYERASGELLLLLNNDVEPFEAGWLREMVLALEADGVQAVGATLLHPEAPDSDTNLEPIVQHRAVRFHWREGMVRPFNFGDGESLWQGAFGIELRSPAVTAACMLLSAETFKAFGGLDAAYLWGTEDVDLGLRLLYSGGESRGCGRAVLIHRESSTQQRESSDFRRLNRLNNRRVLLERWGPRLLREYRLARLRHDAFWTDGAGPHVAITLTSLDPHDGWGDWYTAHELGEALEMLGWRVSYAQRKGDDWYELPEDLDYLISLMDPFDLRRLPSHVTAIAWIRNWTERWLQQPWFDRADVLLASSARTAELIKEATGRQSVHFPLATNPARFSPRDPLENLACDYVFTGNHWGVEREIQHALAPKDGERLRIYGRGWEEVPALRAHSAGEASYEELPAIYASAKLVLDDTQGPTLPYGALNARVFDALAAGSLVITNCQAGVRDLFDEEFPVWSSDETLREQIDALLIDEDRREALVHRYRRQVLERHTYAHRAHQLRSTLLEHERRLSFAIKIGAPDREQATRWGDLHFAEAFARELRRAGHRACVQTLDEWEDEAGLLYDVAIHLKGLSRYHPKPGQLNVLWSISHPAELTGEECDGYDLVLVASELFAAELEQRTSTPVHVFEQATDPRLFYPDPRPEYAHDLVYVANSRNVLRPIVRDLLPTDLDLAIWGANWDGLIDTKYVVGEHIPNDQLRHVYSSAQVVLCDHWEDMREHGYISNRIYDALACGAFVISDDVPGLKERFGDRVAVYDGREELQDLIGRVLASVDARDSPAPEDAGLPRQHSFATRVQELMARIDSSSDGWTTGGSTPYPKPRTTVSGGH